MIDAGDGDEDLFDDEEGEGMVGFDELEGDARRREALEEQRRVGSLGTEQRRLSRELEEGFRDESEDEDEDEDSKRRRSLSRERLY